MALARAIAEYVDSVSYKDLDTNTVEQARYRIVDTLGCAIGAYHSEPCVISRKIASGINSDFPARILGTDINTSLEMAVFTNSVMIRYLDYMDTYLSKEPAHPADNIGTCLSVAQACDLSGKDFLLAVTLAYEIQSRLCDAAKLRHLGWDHVTYGLISTTCAMAKLMNLSVDVTEQAINIALTAHIPLRLVRYGEISMWKGCAFAEAAKNAVFSTLLAREGLTGPANVFEAGMGFFNQVSGKFSLDFNQFGGRGRPFRIQDSIIKHFPAEIHAQTAVEDGIELHHKLGSQSLDRISEIDIFTHEAGLTIIGAEDAKWHPTNKETADHSLPYMVVRSLIDGDLQNASYSQEKLTDEHALALLQRTKVYEDISLTQKYPESVSNRVVLKLENGNNLSVQKDYPLGHPKNPMSRVQIEDKFKSLTKPVLGSEKPVELLSKLWKLEDLQDLSEIYGIASIPAGPYRA